MVRPLLNHCFLDYVYQTPAFPFADRSAFFNFHNVADAGFVFRIVHTQFNAAIDVFTITRMFDLVIDLTGDAFVAAF